MKEILGKILTSIKSFFKGLWVCLKRGIFRDKNYWWILLVAGIALIQFATKKYVYGDDTYYHMANIRAIMDAWGSGHFDMKIFPMIADNLGYGAGIFYPQLFHAVAAGFGTIFSPFTSNLTWAIKATHILGMFLSGVTMYILMKKVVGKKNVALVTAIIYMIIPYHVVDIVIRDAQAEELLFVFLPMVVLGLKNLIEKNYRGFYGWFIVGYTGLVYSHLVMTMFITLMLAVGLLINWKRIFRKETVKKFCIATAAVALLCAPFLVPMLEHKFSGTEYRVFSNDVMITREALDAQAFPLYRLVMPTDDQETLKRGAINAVVLMIAIIAIVKYRKLKVDGDKFFIFSIIATLLFMGIFMYSNLFPWGKLYNLFWAIQFPWRLQVVIAFAASVMAGIYLASVAKEEKAAVKYLLLGSSVLLWTMVLGVKGVTWGQVEEYKYDYSWKGCGHQREYLPVKTNKEWIRHRGNEITTKDKVSAEVVKDNTPDLVFKIEGQGTVELPRIYYLGYKIENVQTGKPVEYAESENGMIEVVVQTGEYKISYEGTTAGKIANALAVVTVATAGGCAVYYAKKRK